MQPIHQRIPADVLQPGKTERTYLRNIGLSDDERSSMQMTEEAVRRILKTRQLRARVIGTKLFSDPAWEILLQLFAAYLGGTSTTAAMLCEASEVPPSTLLRWISKLESDGLVEPRGDESLEPSAVVELSPLAIVRLRQYFAATAAAGREGL